MAGAAGSDGARRVTIDDIKPDLREVKAVEWPGTGRQVGVLHLNVGELLEAHAAARETCKRRGIPADMWSAEAIEAEEMTQQCYRMLVDPEARIADARVFTSIEQVRKRLDAEERGHFCAQHERLYGAAARGLIAEDQGASE